MEKRQFIAGLLKEAKHIQDKHNKYHKTCRTKETVARTFAKLMGQGKINAAMKLLEESSSGGMLDLTPEVISDLKSKHPTANPISTPHTLLQGPIQHTESYIFDEIDEDNIKRAAIKTKGSAGPSGLHAELFRSILCSNKHPTESKELREQIALLTRQLATRCFDPALTEAFVACRLIPLAKSPSGVRPIGVGETLRRIMGKVVSWTLTH
jgi:hypothetical protein